MRVVNASCCNLTIYKTSVIIVYMKVQRGFKYRLYPNQEQAIALARQFGASRFVYNHFLRARMDYYREHKDDESKKGLTYHDTALALTQLKKLPDYAWLTEANAQSLQQALRDLDVAYNNFFNKRAQFPTFHKKHGRQSFRVPQGFRLEGDTLIIPKTTPIKIVLHRPVEGVMKSVTISRTPTGKHFASILCEVDMPDPGPKPNAPVIGVDLGLKSYIVTSEGERVDAPKFLRQAEKRLKRLQRCLSRRQKGGKNRDKVRRAVARQHEKVANQRADFLHKLTHRLTVENQAVMLESLNVKGMLANHSLAKSISDAAWGEFIRQMQYKGGWYGCAIGEIHRFFPSSKLHNKCGFIHDGLRLSDREWVCPACGELVDRDWNAALNIRDFGVLREPQELTPGESRNSGSRNQEASAFRRG